jgi:hypothetical protein
VDIFDLIAAQAGQPAPFDSGIGSDPLAGDEFAASWTFNYSPLVDVVSASISFGIVDDDSASDGDQLGLFQGGSEDLTGVLNPLMMMGESGQYRVYSIVLPLSLFPELATGSVTFSLALIGPVLSPNLFGDPVIDPSNGANLIYSTLTIEAGRAIVPEPSSLGMIISAFGFLGAVGFVRTKLRQRATD